MQGVSCDVGRPLRRPHRGARQRGGV